MEEKERYELIGYCSYRDTETGVIGDNFVELLNQQEKENQQLKQQLHDLPKKIVGEIREKVCEHSYVTNDYNLGEIDIKTLTFNRILDTILKKYGGENGSK